MKTYHSATKSNGLLGSISICLTDTFVDIRVTDSDGYYRGKEGILFEGEYRECSDFYEKYKQVNNMKELY